MKLHISWHHSPWGPGSPIPLSGPHIARFFFPPFSPFPPNFCVTPGPKKKATPLGAYNIDSGGPKPKPLRTFLNYPPNPRRPSVCSSPSLGIWRRARTSIFQKIRFRTKPSGPPRVPISRARLEPSPVSGTSTSIRAEDFPKASGPPDAQRHKSELVRACRRGSQIAQRLLRVANKRGI